MTKFKVSVPPTMEQGNFDFIVSDEYYTAAQDALSQYNSARDHDGQRHLKRMPTGTKYTKIRG
ncbi:MAG: hypothetical protein KAS32_06185 [Candidatus Peribacteraceae bacterium]|nr:hypothetical protein [Candidatus Peribacteraceae bacterium]